MVYSLPNMRTIKYTKTMHLVVGYQYKREITLCYRIRIRIRIRIFIIPINGPTIGANKLHTLIIVIGGNYTYIYINIQYFLSGSEP